MDIQVKKVKDKIVLSQEGRCIDVLTGRQAQALVRALEKALWEGR